MQRLSVPGTVLGKAKPQGVLIDGGVYRIELSTGECTVVKLKQQCSVPVSLGNATILMPVLLHVDFGSVNSVSVDSFEPIEFNADADGFIQFSHVVSWGIVYEPSEEGA